MAPTPINEAEPLMMVVSACDETYFPLLKGLVLSLLDRPLDKRRIRLGFIDIGCTEQSLNWLIERGIEVRNLKDSALGALGDERLGYHRAQTCRPFLPLLFPKATVLAWVDCDTWFQDPSFLEVLRLEALTHPDHLIASPEIHYSYSKINEDVRQTHEELRGYYTALYDHDIAEDICILPTVNSGFFAMQAAATLWSEWQAQIELIYGREYDKHSPVTRHFAEQMSLNRLVRAGVPVRYFDPLYNYLCLWNPPVRMESGKVCVALPPYAPVGMLHLAGGWRHFGHLYLERKLLYQGGEYLTEDERRILTASIEPNQFR